MQRPRAGFTLIELMLAVAIAVIMMTIAIPSLMGHSEEQKFLATFEAFDKLARQAQANAAKEQQTWKMVWETGRIFITPVDKDSSQDAPPIPVEGDAGAPVSEDSITVGEEESYSLTRPTALLPPKNTPAEWTFWRSGTCEPVIIEYSGPLGTWRAQYNPLTGHGEITDQALK